MRCLHVRHLTLSSEIMDRPLATQTGKVASQPFAGQRLDQSCVTRSAQKLDGRDRHLEVEERSLGTDKVKRVTNFEVGTLPHLTRASFLSHYPHKKLFQVSDASPNPMETGA
jgi:hypothetical protein